MHTRQSGGLLETAEKAVTVRPEGLPAGSIVVTTVTPAPRDAIAALNCSGDTGISPGSCTTLGGDRARRSRGRSGRSAAIADDVVDRARDRRQVFGLDHERRHRVDELSERPEPDAPFHQGPGDGAHIDGSYELHDADGPELAD